MKRSNSSIRRQLLAWLLIPLCCLCLIASALAYQLATSFASDAYDGQLVNSAAAVAARLRFDGVQITVDLPPAAQAILRHNTSDKLYYQILEIDGRRISGDAVLPKPQTNLESDKPVFRYSDLNGEKIRIARIRVIPPHAYDHPVFVQVAETLNGRENLTHRILGAIVIPQVILIVLGAAAVSVGVTKGLSPLKKLERAISRRSKLDLTPVEPSQAPSEVYPLILAINDLIERLKHDIESQERFVANAAHQFRTPIAGLKTYVSLAQRVAKEEKLQPILSQLNSGCDRLTNLVNKLLSLARAEPANKLADRTNLDLNILVSAVTSDLICEALDKDIDLQFLPCPNPALLEGSQGGLTDLTVNLVENALRYTQPGGEVKVKIEEGETYLTLAVEDNGPGIPVEERERVFERFYRILGSDVQGSGLGLAIVKEIAAAHQAHIHLSDSAKDSGTCIKIVFPKAGRVPSARLQPDQKGTSLRAAANARPRSERLTKDRSGLIESRDSQ
ncbi:MAG: sensor histidine kinase [Candidatus Melainabacteria bacterium]|nr:sensor histidine kinase [Candidatus Melainabacteria bacterium]